MIAIIATTNSANGSIINRALQSLLHPTEFVLMIEIVFGLLILATIMVELIARIRPQARPMVLELRARTRSWWIMVALFVLAISVQWWLTIIFLAMLSYVALKEFYTLVHLRLADRRVILLAYLAIPIQYYWVYREWYGMFIVFVPVYMSVVIPLRMVVAGQTERFTTSLGKLHWGLMAFVFGLSHLAYFLSLEFREDLMVAVEPRALLVYVIFLAEFNDVLQYVFGKTLGQRKMTPTISPNKTWEGFLGGLVCTTILAVLLRFLTPMDVWHAAFAGVLIATLGPVGGMVISAIKRDVGVKDSGSLIPGHGGILDRIDSLCFSAPIFFHFIRFYYGA